METWHNWHATQWTLYGRSVFIQLWESNIQFSIEWKSKIEKKKLFFSSEANILNLCCPWISNVRASGIYTMGLVPEIPLIHRRLTPNIAGYLSLHGIVVHSPNKSCLFFFKSNSVSFWFWEYEELIHLKIPNYEHIFWALTFCWHRDKELSCGCYIN